MLASNQARVIMYTGLATWILQCLKLKIPYSCTGEQFRREYSQLSEVCSILPRNVNIMALTATATKSLRNEVSILLNMENPVLVPACPDKKNIKYLVANHVTMEKTFGPIIDDLYEFQTDVGRTIIFWQ